MNAPVVLFVYNRVDHVEQTLSALSQNFEAPNSDLFIFSDGPKEKNDKRVSDVREYICNETWKKKFKTVTVIQSQNNKGLANSIISGVDEIIRKYGRVIVIEDDCISSPDFLSYMNNCLEYYENSNQVWSIGGYTFNIDFPNDYTKDVYLMGRTCSYAWATWLDRWEKVDWNVSDYNSFKWNLRARREFNKYGNDRAKMLDLQQLGKKNSWAIRFCYAMYKNKQYTIYPRYTKIKNIGYDVGTHVSGDSSQFVVNLPDKVRTSKLEHVDIDEKIVKDFASKFKRPWYILFVAYIKNVVLKI